MSADVAVVPLMTRGVKAAAWLGEAAASPNTSMPSTESAAVSRRLISPDYVGGVRDTPTTVVISPVIEVSERYPPRGEPGIPGRGHVVP